MPFNGSGGTSQPSGSIYPASEGTLIESGKFNTSIADIYSMLASCIVKDGQTSTTAAIPFASGVQTDTVSEKTSATGVTVDGVLLKDGRVDSAQGSDITAATTINLETATGNVVDVTGDTQIDAITLSQGHWRLVRFTGTPQITHGASLVLPTSANITAAAGDYALFVGYASSVVRCPLFVRAAAAAHFFGLTDPGADRLVFWDDSAGANAHLALSGLTITGTTLAVDAATSDAAGKVELATLAEVQTGTDTTRAVTPSTMQNGKSVQGTLAATTSGTEFDFTIPSWATEITVMLNGVSLSGTDNLVVRIGDGSGVATTGYSGGAASGTTQTAATTGFHINALGTGSTVSGSLILTLMDSATFLWSCQGVFGNAAGGLVHSTGGTKALSDTLTTVRLTRSGTDTFDAGSVNVRYR